MLRTDSVRRISAGAHFALVSLSICLSVASCTQKAEDAYSPSKPIPSPKIDQPLPPSPPSPPEVIDDTPKESTVANAVPVFQFPLASDLTLNEGSAMTLNVFAVDPEGGPVSYYYQCPYACPDGMVVSDIGQVTWRPNFAQSGRYDVRFVAMDGQGETALTEYIRIQVVNVNRPPEISSVSVLPDKTPGTTTLVCDVKKTDKDGDAMTTSRTWKIDGVLAPSMTSSQEAITNFRARQSVTCLATATDQNGGISIELESPAYVVPNTPPQIGNLRILNSANQTQTFKVGDHVACPADFSDLDNHVVSRTKTEVLTSSDRLVIASSTLPSDIDLVVPMAVAHRQIFCRVTVTDGYDQTTAESLPVLVQNSPPVVQSVLLYPEAGAAFKRSGDSLICEGVFYDPDGDVVIPSVTFYNGSSTRGGGSEAGSTGVLAKKRYRLRTVYDVIDPSNADIHADSVKCSVVATDIYTGSSTLNSASLILLDSPPSLAIDSSGAASQSLKTGEAMAGVQLQGKDFDGDLLTYQAVSDTCASKGVSLSVSTGGLVSSLAIPTPTGPQSDRDCSVSFRALAGGIPTSAVAISLTIKNHTPVLTCSNLTQVLGTAPENHLRVKTADGEAMTEGICGVSDVDDPSGVSTSYIFSINPDACALGAAASTGTIDNRRYRVNATMGLDECTSSVVVSDGGLSSNLVVYNLKPAVDFGVSTSSTFDSACVLSVAASPGKPSFNAPYEYSASFPPYQLVLGDSGAASNAFPFTGGFVSTSKAGGRLAISDLFGRVGANWLMSWIMPGVNPTTSARRDRTVYRQFSVGRAAVESPRISEPMAGQNLFKKDVGKGRQVSISAGCVDDVGGSCLGASRASVAVGDEHTCALHSAGAGVYCWGSNAKRQLGQLVSGDYINSATPGVVTGLDGSDANSKAVAIVAGGSFSCALTESGRVRCWGDNRYGQLGSGGSDSVGVGEAFDVVTTGGVPISNLTAVAAGDSHACALASSGAIWCWGNNEFGQLGLGTVDLATLCSGKPCVMEAKQMADLPIAGEIVSGIAAGGGSTCLTLASEKAICFGDFQYGQLGNGTYTKRYGIWHEIIGDLKGNDDHICQASELSASGCELSAVASLRQIRSIAVGPENACVVSLGGKLDCYGAGSFGQLGDGTTSTSKAEPPCLDSNKVCFTYTDAYSSGVASASPGQGFSCAMTRTRGVECFGRNDFGQLGANSLASSSAAHSTVLTDSLVPLANVVALVSGKSHSCAVIESQGSAQNQIVCWGAGSSGQLGDGDLSAHFSRVAKVVSSFPAAARICEYRYSLTPIGQ